jgi:hypothetical protein
MDGYDQIGTWNDLQLGSATCFVRKYDDETSITFTAKTIRKSATVQAVQAVSNNKLLVGQSVSMCPITFAVAREMLMPCTAVGGTLYYKDINGMNLGNTMVYNNDRIVWYAHTTMTGTKDFTAFVSSLC